MPIPNIQSGPLFDGQSVDDATDWDSFSRAFNVTGLVSGCVTTAYGAPAMGVQVSAGSVAVNGFRVNVAAASVTIAAPSASDRRDIIVANSAGSVYAVQGTPCGTANWNRDTYPGLPPIKPSIPSSSVFLADIYVGASLTAIASGDIEINATRIMPSVLSFNGRSASVTLQATDIEAFYTAGGQLIVGAGSGTGQIISAGSVGTVLTSTGTSGVPTWQIIPGTGAASAGVQSFNTRFGPVTFQLSDAESVYTSKGQIMVGTGTNTAELLSSSASVGYVLTSNGAASIPSWQPSGAASVNAAAIEATFTAPGQTYVGTGNGTGELLSAGSVGTVFAGTGSASVPSWKSTSSVIESSFTVPGQLYVGTGSGTGELLTSGSVGYVLTSNGGASVPSWQASAGAGYILAQHQFAPTSASVYNLSAASITALDTTNLTVGPFTVPSSGSIILEAICNLEAALSSNGAVVLGSLAYLNHVGGGVIGPSQGVFTTQIEASGATTQGVFVVRVTYKALVTGLVSGESLQLDLAGGASTSGTATGSIVVQGTSGYSLAEFGPALLTVYNPNG